MPEVTNKQFRIAQYNYYSYTGRADGFRDFTRSKTGIGLSCHDGDVDSWPRQIPDNLYKLIMQLSSPHYHAILKAMECHTK